MVERRPDADGCARKEARAERRRLRHRRHVDRAAAGVGERLDETGVGAHPSVDFQSPHVEAGVCLGGLEKVGPPVGDPLQHGPHDFGPARAPGDADERAPGAEVPHRCAEAEEGGNEEDSARVVHGGGDLVGVRGGVDDPEVVAEPLDARACREHDRLEAPCEAALVAPRDDGERAVQPLLGKGGALAPEAAVEHPSCPERCFGHARLKAPLADERSLLVAGDAGDGRRSGKGAASPTTPLESTMRGSTLAGMRSASQRARSQPAPSPVTSPVTPALVWSVT